MAGNTVELWFTLPVQLLTAWKTQNMLRFFKRCSQGRRAWLLMAITALALELTALYFQHVMLLQRQCDVYL